MRRSTRSLFLCSAVLMMAVPSSAMANWVFKSGARMAGFFGEEWITISVFCAPQDTLFIEAYQGPRSFPNDGYSHTISIMVDGQEFNLPARVSPEHNAMYDFFPLQANVHIHDDVMDALVFGSEGSITAWGETEQFNLAGSRRALGALYDACAYPLPRSEYDDRR